VELAILGHHRQIGSIGTARHRQDTHAQRIKPGKLHGPARFLDHHAVAGAQQAAADDVQRMGGADGGDDLFGTGVQIERAQPLRERAAQARIAQRFAVLQ
jgi:hypothetical protein